MVIGIEEVLGIIVGDIDVVKEGSTVGLFDVGSSDGELDGSKGSEVGDIDGIFDGQYEGS